MFDTKGITAAVKFVMRLFYFIYICGKKQIYMRFVKVCDMLGNGDGTLL